MIVGVALFEIHIEGSRSLKDKRMVVRSLRDRIRRRFEVSVAEVGAQDLHQRGRFGVSVVSTDRAVIETMFNAILRLVEEEGDATLVGWNQDLIPFESNAQLEMPHLSWGNDPFDKDEENP